MEKLRLKILDIFKTTVQKLAVSLKRFPEAIVLAAAATLIMITMNHLEIMSGHLDETLRRVAMVLALGIPLALCLKIFLEGASKIKKTMKLLLYGAAALCLIFYYFYLLPPDINLIAGIRYIALTLALYCLFTFIPYLDKRPGYEQYIIALIRQFLITVLYAVVLFLGLAAMVFTIDQLLFHLSGRLYLDLWLLVVGIFAPAFFLSDVPGYGQDMLKLEYSKVLRALLFFIVMPILAAYTGILYLYFAKILITRNWPVGMVSHLVLWYSLISTFIMFVIYPLRHTNQWVCNFLTFIPKLILPLLAMMFVAMGIRVNAYGITENRYFVLVAGFWATGAMFYTALFKERKNVFLAVTLAIITVLSVFGPWSAFNVSKYSQTSRFGAILERNGMLQNGNIVKAPETISEDDKDDIRSIILYFSRSHGLEKLKYLPPNFRIENMQNTFGFEMDYNPGGNRYFSYHVQNDNMLIDIKDYDYFYNAAFGKLDSTGPGSSPLEVIYKWEDKRLIIKDQGQEIYNKDISDIALQLHNRNEGKTSVSQADLSFVDANDHLQVLYVFRYVSGHEERGTGKVNIDPPDFYIFIKRK